MKLLALNLCETEGALRTFKLINIFLAIAKIIVPLIIICIGIKDMIGVVTNGKDDELKAKFNQLVRRIIAGLIIFIIPSLLNYAFNLYSGYKDTVSSFAACSTCLTNAKECDDLMVTAKAKYEAEHKDPSNFELNEEEIYNYSRQENTNNQTNPNNTTPSNNNHQIVENGKYFDSTNVTKISGLTEQEFINVLQNSKAYKGKAKVYIPLAHDLILAEKNHGVNAFYLIGLYSYESGWLGSELTKQCNNIGGVRFYSQSYGNGKKVTNCRNGYAGFDSISEFIDFHANLLQTKYLTPNGSHYNGYGVGDVAKDYGSGNGIDTIIRIATNVSTQ